MELVINRCYGGFGLSPKAVELLKECGHVKAIPIAEYFTGEWAQGEQYRNDHIRSCGLLADKKFIYSDDHRDDENRNCPHLVAVVKKLGDKADGQHAKLEVVEIPDGVEYEINDYDGQESVHEKHRVW
jgi:hypothetical protein